MPQCSVVLLISTYDLGRQPFGLASAAAALRAAGIDVVCADLAKERLSEESVRRAAAIGFFLPMHTATRLALPVIDRVRALNPDARLVAYGLYAPLNAPMLRERGASVIIGGEFEDALVAAVASVASMLEFGRRRSEFRARHASLGARRASRAFPGTRSRRAAGADEVLHVATRRGTQYGRLYRGQQGLQTPVPPLSDRARLRWPVPRRPRRCRHG